MYIICTCSIYIKKTPPPKNKMNKCTMCVCALFSEKVAHEGGHTPICLCCFLTFHCRHSAKPSNQSVTCPVLLMDGTGHLLVVTVTLETRIDGTEERKNNTERGRDKNPYVDMLMLAGQTSSFVMNSKTWLTYFTRNTCWSFLRAWYSMSLM